MECLPIVQEDFPPDYKSVRDMLRAKISTCNALVHLAGFYYGAEPQPVLPGPDRRSFTQMEYEIAMELKLPCYVFLCGKNFPFDSHEPEPEEKQQLQLDHRARLLQRDELFYEFASPEELSTRTRELQLSVEGLRAELAKERGRRRLMMIAAIAALVIAIAGGYILFGRQQRQEAVIVRQSSDLARLQAQLDQLNVVVAKVNVAQEQARREGVESGDASRRVALQLVAKDTGRSVKEVQKDIERTTQTAGEVAAAARAQGVADPSGGAESRRIESDALLKLAAAHEAAGRYEKALAAGQEGLALLDRAQEPQKWIEASTFVGRMEHLLEHFQEARTRYEGAFDFASKQTTIGPTHPATLALAPKLVRTVIQLRDFDAAERFARFIMEACQKKLGPDAPDTLLSMGMLADALIGRRASTVPGNASTAEMAAANESLAEGEALIRRAIQAQERSNGPDSFEAVALVATLAQALSLKADYNGAVAAYERVQKFREKTAGADAEITISGSILLANALKETGDLEGAEKLLRRAVAWREKNLGPDHPETIDCLNLLGLALLKEKKSDEAEEVFQRGFTIAERALGPEHSTTMSLAYSLAGLMWDRKEYAGAETLLRRRVKWRIQTSGPDTASTALATSLLASLLVEKDTKADRAEALKLFQRAYEIQMARLGPDHEQTKASAAEIRRLAE